MSLVVIRRPGHEDRVFRIRSERVTIGRDGRADLVLDDAAVSRIHAHLEADGNHCAVVDQQSTNGLKVNGERAERAELVHGDVIKIGKFRLEFYDESKVDLLQVTRIASLRSARSLKGTANMSTLHLQPEDLEAEDPTERTCKHALLVRTDGHGGAWRPGAGRITIGPGGDVPIDLMLTSQPVAEIRWDGEQHMLRAFSWAHRVEVDGRRVREAVLEPGTSLQVGEVAFEFVHLPPDPSAS